MLPHQDTSPVTKWRRKSSGAAGCSMAGRKKALAGATANSARSPYWRIAITRTPGLKPLASRPQPAMQPARCCKRSSFPEVGRWDRVNARQRKRGKRGQFRGPPSLLTSPATRRRPRKAGLFGDKSQGLLLRTDSRKGAPCKETAASPAHMVRLPALALVMLLGTGRPPPVLCRRAS